jgi:hypothetical protein
MFVKLLVPYKNFGAGSVVKKDSIPQDVLKDLVFAGGAKVLGDSGYQTRMMSAENTTAVKAEKTSKKSKQKDVEQDSE